jgi:hypothetical protein
MGATMPSESNEQFFKRGMGIQEILQAVEDMLIDGGYDHYMVATEHGTFSWGNRGSGARGGSPESVMPRDGAIIPMTLGNMRANGVRSPLVYCSACPRRSFSMSMAYRGLHVALS